MTFISDRIRSHFPSLRSGAIFFDNPGGTQVPLEVIRAVSHYYETANANTHGAYATSQRTDKIILEARQSMRDFLNASTPEEIIFGANMTTLTFHLTRSLAKWISLNDEVVVTCLDHDANIAPWLSLEEHGALIKWVDITTPQCRLNLPDFARKLSPKTKIVAVGYASNAVGTINDLEKIIDLAHKKGAMVFVDAVHFAPHGPIDVKKLDADFLACSAYKFYGPHLGVLYGKKHLLEKLIPYKVRPASNRVPEKFETGTLNHEGLAGLIAAIDFISSIGDSHLDDFSQQFTSFSGRALKLKVAMTAIKSYEANLCRRLLTGLKTIPGINIFGITDSEKLKERTPTVAFTVKGRTPRDIAQKLGENEIYVWDGNYYALALMERLNIEQHGGAVRVGLACYNTAEEVDRFLQVLKTIVPQK